MDLKEQFDILPHGVSNDENGEVYANFKMIISVKRPEKKEYITKQDWAALTERINESKWSFELKNGLLNFSNNHNSKFKVIFRIKNHKNLITESENFHFSKELINDDKFFKAFDLVIISDENGNSRKLYWPSNEDDSSFKINNNATMIQFPITTKKIEENEQLRGFTKSNQDPVILGEQHKYFLSKADDYARTRPDLEFVNKDKLVLQENQEYNLETIIGSIMDEPAVAEIRFGLIRQFRVKVSDIIEKNDGKLEYGIKLPESLETRKNFLLLGQKGKYYNGLKKIFLTADKNGEPNDFESVYVNYSDPFNNYLNSVEQKVSHPDGIYIIAKYKEHLIGDQKEIIDPFDSPIIKGFNVIVSSPNNSTYSSLSPHRTEIKFKAKPNHIEEYRHEYNIKLHSGVLTPQAELLIGEGKKVRNNLLFTWRGDNLLVNREIPNSELEKNKKYGSLETQQDSELEGLFIKENVYTTNEQLVPNTQCQLVHYPADQGGTSYTFYARVVSATGHYIPLKSELDPSDKFTLTFEDYVENNKKDFELVTAVFDLAHVNKVPIKNLIMVGKDEYKSGSSSFVDNKQNIVLNKRNKEREEIRYLFPPAIKFEDFRYQSYLTVDKLKGNRSNISQKAFVYRCIKYQNRLKFEPPVIADRFERVNYLADPRGEFVLLTPKDLFTHNQLKISNSKIPLVGTARAFSFQSVYPYFRESFSSLIRVKSELNGSKIELEQKSKDAQNLFKVENDGVYSFKIFTSNNQNIKRSDLSDYTSIDFNIAIVSNPEQPLFKESSISVYRNSKSNLRYQFSASFELENNSVTWRSIKYFEQTTDLQLVHDQFEVNRLKREFLTNNPESPPLMKNECPYEMFIKNSGDQNLKTFIYPKRLELIIKVVDKSLYSEIEYLFKLPLNKDELISCYLTDEEIIVKINDEDLQIFNYDDKVFTLVVEFEPEENAFSIKYNGDKIRTLVHWLNQEISSKDFIISDCLMDYLNFSPESFQLDLLNKKNQYVFIVDGEKPYSSNKHVELFASSAFQPYFPNTKMETDLGTIGSNFSLSIPNNIEPSVPKIDSDVLYVKTIDDSWETTDYNSKSIANESVLRILLDQDFMLEGMNKLGVILKKINNGRDDTLPSNLGEDITKLTNTDWSDADLDMFINYNHEYEVIKKYFNRNDRKFYKKKDSVYFVLECTPYYNTLLKQWQVILPLKLFNSETMFVKLAAVKIAPGHGLVLDNNSSNSSSNPYVDVSGTNLSELSEPIELPIYNKMRTFVDRINSKKFVINHETASYYEDKQYYIAIKEKFDEDIVLTPRDSNDGLKNFANFSYVSKNGNIKKGKILRAGMLDSIEINIENETAKSIMIMEFEVHANAVREANSIPECTNPLPGSSFPPNWPPDLDAEYPVIPRNPFPEIELKKINELAFKTNDIVEIKDNTFVNIAFVNYNPLFDQKGIRLISMSEFIL